MDFWNVIENVIENSKNLFGYFELTLNLHVNVLNFTLNFFSYEFWWKKKTKEYNIEKYSKKHAILSNFYHIVLPICARQFYKNFDLSRSILRVAIQRIIDISVSRFPLFSINHGVRLIMTFFATTKHKDLRPLFVRPFPQEGRKSHP